MSSTSTKKHKAAAAAAAGAASKQSHAPSTGAHQTSLREQQLALERAASGLNTGPKATTLAELPEPNTSTSSTLPKAGKGGATTGSTQKASTEVDDTGDDQEAEDERVRSSAFAMSGGSRRGSGNDAVGALFAQFMQLQRDHAAQVKGLQQQMLEQQQRFQEAQQRAQEEHRETLRRMEERQVVLAAPRPTVTESSPPATTALGEQALVPTDSVQSQAAAPVTVLRTPARIGTPMAKSVLRPEPTVPEGDDDDDDGDDDPRSPPPNARSGRKVGGTLGARPTMVVAQQTAIALPTVDLLCQDKLIKNGKVLNEWIRQISDRIEIAEFNDGRQPYDFERRFLFAKMTMDTGVRDYLTAYNNEKLSRNQPTISSWEQLIAVLVAHYAPARDAEEASREFYKAEMQASETMEQFMHRMGAIYSRLQPGELPGHTASELVIQMISEQRFPTLVRNIKEEQRQHKLAHGVGMDFLALRNKLPEMALAEPNQSIHMELEALKADIMRLKGGGGGKTVKAAEKVNAVQARTFRSEMSDDELKSKFKWSAERIKEFRENQCFNCKEKGHHSADCPHPKKGKKPGN
jgi:hypothetical protein